MVLDRAHQLAVEQLNPAGQLGRGRHRLGAEAAQRKRGHSRQGDDAGGHVDANATGVAPEAAVVVGDWADEQPVAGDARLVVTAAGRDDAGVGLLVRVIPAGLQVKDRHLVGLHRPSLGEYAGTISSGCRNHGDQRYGDPGQRPAAHGTEHEVVHRADEENVQQHEAGGQLQRGQVEAWKIPQHRRQGIALRCHRGHRAAERRKRPTHAIRVVRA